MDVFSSNPRILVVFGVVLALIIAAAVRWGMNVHDDIEDWQEEREAEGQKRKAPGE